MPFSSINIIWSHASWCWHQSVLRSCTCEQRAKLCRIFVCEKFDWLNLQPKKLFKMPLIIFLWKRGNVKERGRVIVMRSFCSWRNTKIQNIWSKTLQAVKMNYYWKVFCISNQLITSGECDYTFSSSLYELLQEFIHTREVIMSQQ